MHHIKHRKQLQSQPQVVEVVNENPNIVSLTTRDLFLLELTNLAKTSVDTLQSMWDDAGFDDAERKAAFSGVFEVLKGTFEEEIKLVKEDLEFRTLGNQVTKLRGEINALWEEALIGDDSQKEKLFPQYFEPLDCLEESAINTHEEYLNGLKAWVTNLQPILQKVARRETIVQERIELEHLQRNPDRLMDRAPNARDRKREETLVVHIKNMDKLTKELVEQIQEWEETNGFFTYLGERYFDRMNRQEVAYVEIRDSLRNARKKSSTVDNSNNVLKMKSPTKEKRGLMMSPSS
mmetsp:Transcript_29113/g.41534  ORF Transcript_29113/g.41534 Transcript_29113/m.41534 type:complete len:292 (+) Transcript_29113:100-975(+)